MTSGGVYSGVMTDANEAIVPVHNRMPVLLYLYEYDVWMHGGLSDPITLQQRNYLPQSILMERTNDLRVAKRQAVSEAPASL
ncbi:UNVERIFIED_ORG: putative SOS response-associated peptidase YedK [Rhizobium esperanzae]|nr:putative SOS response-associated peptidase YedK [Rhizobium esperanzae]